MKDKPGIVSVEIVGCNMACEYLQAIGFLLTTVGTNHLSENFNYQNKNGHEDYVFAQIKNAGRLIQDIAEALAVNFDEIGVLLNQYEQNNNQNKQ